MLSFVNIIFNITNISALSYQSEVGISFTFNPTLSIALSSSDLTISNLTPGTTSDSNSINVNVATNSAYGYTLSAAITGSNSNLTHTNETNIFSSITANANLPSLDTDNSWGYSYKNNLAPTPTWSNYSGLSTDASKVLFNTDSNTNSSIDFKIGAKASNAQASGTYTNTINFIVVSKPMPKTIEDIAYMQTFGELVPTDLQSVKNSMIKNTTYTLKDARDEQEYIIAKLEDGKIWMTKNLNLAGGTEITSKFSDVPANYTLPTTNGFQEGNKLPESSQTGFGNNSIANIYNSENNTNNCRYTPGCYSYYTWVAATAGSGTSISVDNADAPYSICPKGWRLPTIRSTIAGNSDFYQLAVAYGMNSEASSQSTVNFYNNAGPNTTANFLLANFYYINSFYGGGNGNCWSSTSYDSANAHNFNYNPSSVNSAGKLNRKYGLPVRCLAK